MFGIWVLGFGSFDLGPGTREFLGFWVLGILGVGHFGFWVLGLEPSTFE